MARRARISLPALTVVVGAVLLGLGVPRLLGALTLFPGDPIADAIKDGQAVGDARLTVLLDSRAAARRFLPASKTELDIALGRLAALKATSSGGSERKSLLDQTIDSLRRGLAAAPGDSFAWARLAYAIALRDGRGSAAPAWRMSILTSPADPKLVLWRVKFGFGLLPHLDAADQPRLAQQIRFSWRFARRDLADFAREHGLQLVLRRVLSTEPDVAQLNQLFAPK